MAKGDYTIEADVRRAQRFMKSISPRGVNRAASRTINRVLGPARTATSKSIRDEISLQAKPVKRGLKKESASPKKLRGVIHVKQRNFSLRLFKPKGNRGAGGPGKKPLTVEVEKGNRQRAATVGEIYGKPNQTVEGAFQLERGKPIFGRTSKSRYPIEKLVINNALVRAFNDTARRKVDKAVDERWQKNFRHNLDREIEKARQKSR